MLSRFLASLLFLIPVGSTFAADWKAAAAPLMTKWGKKVTPENAWQEYPRPQLVRKDWQNLNGLWDYGITTQGAGPPAKWDGQILVPYPIESALSGVGKRLTSKDVLWYSRMFEVPAAWKGKRVLLHFEAVDWHTTVLVNGKELSPLGDKDADAHSGGSDPFAYDITDLLKEGPNALLVRVWDPTDGRAQPRGKQVQKPGGIWYTPVTGIWQTAWLEPVPTRAIESLKACCAGKHTDVDPMSGRPKGFGKIETVVALTTVLVIVLRMGISSAFSCGSVKAEPGWSTTPPAPIASPRRSACVSEMSDFSRISGSVVAQLIR